MAGSSPSGRTPAVVTVVLNTNRRDDTLACLSSLAGQTMAARNHVIVLDNQSHDGSRAAIRDAFPDVELITLKKDGGYAGNNNVGIVRALAYRPEWVLVLNEDTVLDPRCLERMLDGGRAAHVGIVGPMVLHHDEPTIVQSAGGRLSHQWDACHIGANEPIAQVVPAAPADVDWVSGCAIMVRSRLIDRVGMLDERFYYYWEETEWCVRARRSGWRIVHVPDARLWHKGVKRDYRPSANVTYYNTRNRLLIMSKHRAPAGARTRTWIRTLRTLTSWTCRPKWRHMRQHRDAMLQGVRDYLLGRWGARPV